MQNINNSSFSLEDVVTAGYIGRGVLQADLKEAENQPMYQGELSLMELVVEAIPKLNAEYDRRYGPNGIDPLGASFIFAYEIAEPFGKEFAEMLAVDWSAQPEDLIKRIFDSADPQFKEPAQAPAYDLVRIKAKVLEQYTQAVARDPHWLRDICVSGFQGLDSRSPEELVDMYKRFFKSNPPLLTTAASTPDGEERATA